MEINILGHLHSCLRGYLHGSCFDHAGRDYLNGYLGQKYHYYIWKLTTRGTHALCTSTQDILRRKNARLSAMALRHESEIIDRKLSGGLENSRFVIFTSLIQ